MPAPSGTETELLTAQYAEAAARYGSASEDGDSVRANKFARHIIALRNRLRGRDGRSKKAILGLMTHQNPWVRLWAAADFRDYDPSKATAVMGELASTSGLISIEAEAQLVVWGKMKLSDS